MAFIFNHVEQTINVTDTSKEIVLDSSTAIKIPIAANTTPLVSEYRNTVIINDSPVANVSLLTDSSGNTTQLSADGRLHFHDSNSWKSISEYSDIDLIRTHNTIRLEQVASPIEDRLSVTEAKAALPTGTIMMWNQSTPPAGWAFCNGANGTPDLRNKFILASNNFESGTGGIEKAEVSITQMPTHDHVAPWGEHGANGAPWGYYGAMNNYGGNGGSDWDNNWPYSSRVGSGTAPTHNNIPPLYALAYIMYLG
ncbi:tail collar domain protein [Vibrio phage 2.275.O._10N.286.54.E11]|nr:tail collar domain protein [Vibrio phage 2.275.O._10N.286.54.E11]